MQDADDEFIAEDEAEHPSATLKKLREKLAAALKEKQEYLDGWQRARADFTNYKREEAAHASEREARTTAGLIENLLPALDALWLAILHDKSGDPTLAMLQSQFGESLRQLGVERYGKEGERFDPRIHEALGETPVEDKEKDHTVMKIERPGYRVGERIIRPAQVTIGSYTSS